MNVFVLFILCCMHVVFSLSVAYRHISEYCFSVRHHRRDVDEKKEGKTLKTTNAMIWAIERQLW